jgi:hypothetical protein
MYAGMLPKNRGYVLHLAYLCGTIDIAGKLRADVRNTSHSASTLAPERGLVDQ